MTLRLLIVQHQGDCPPALMGDWLRDAGCVLDVRHPYAGDELPGDLTGHDAFMVLGGSMGANDDAAHPWLGPVRDLVRDAAQRGTPSLGICLGHQLMAMALGGSVGRNARGQQLGLVPMGWLDPASADPLVGGLQEAHLGVFWNDDIVERAPDGTVELARTPRGEVQAVRYGPSMWGLQLHPEVDHQILGDWAREDRDRHPNGALERVLDEVEDARDALAAGWRPLALRFAALGEARRSPKGHDSPL